MQSKFRWVLPLNLQSSSQVFLLGKVLNKHVTCLVFAADVPCSAQPLLQCSQLECGVSDQSDCSHSFQELPAESTQHQKGCSKYLLSALKSWYFWMHCDYYLTLMRFCFSF